MVAGISPKAFPKLSTAVAVCALVLGGCAQFRIVPTERAADKDPLKNFLVLAPGVRAKGADLFTMDIPLASSSPECRWTAAGDPKKFRAQVFPGGIGADAAVLRITSVRHDTEEQLRKAWHEWEQLPDAKPILKCLTQQNQNAIPDRLAAARPVDGAQSLESAFGLSPGSPLVVLSPGMTVCASDGFKRNSTADDYIPTGPFCARVVRIPPDGMVLDPIRRSIDSISSLPASEASGPIRSIASWAEVPRDAKPREYVVRYPTALPSTGETRPRQVSLLVSLEAGLDFNVRQAAMRCIANAKQVIEFCESPIEKIPEKCGKDNNALVAMKVKPQCYRFGERGVMNVSIPVLINGTQADVEAGALVRDAATRLGRPPTIPLNMARWYGTGQHAVQFEFEVLDVPLLPGDTLSW